MLPSELKKIGIVIANARFTDSERLPNLKYPLRDADEITRVLSDKNYGGFDQVISALDETSTTVRRLVANNVRAHRDAFLLVYYSGHGKIGEDGRLFLATSDTDVDELFGTAVPFKDLIDIVEGYSHRRVGFILDCCYSGLAITDLRGTAADEVRAVTTGKQVFVLCGSSSIQTAKELDKLGHGVLTKGILEGIETGAADRDKDGIITLNDLFYFCSDFARSCSHQEPVYVNRLSGPELPIALVSRLLPSSDVEAVRRKISSLTEANALSEDSSYRLTTYFRDDAVLRPGKNSLEGLFIEYCANRISLEELWRRMNVVVPAPAETIKPKILDKETEVAKVSIAEEKRKEGPLPGQGAADFSAITALNADDLLVRPSAYPTTPMYLLDDAYRIIDWNEAFTLAFDRTMEGRKGRSVLEWTYFLDNYEEVLDHGVKEFGDPDNLPTIDVEKIEYTSIRYGKLSATKRAYQVPNDNGACMAWLVTLGLKFADNDQAPAFHRDLIRLLAMDLMWSEYAMSYDRVLNSTRVYPELLDKLIGGHDGVRLIPRDARILDLGAGTGNLAHKLITSGRDRLIFAAENNRTMLGLLRLKCSDFMRNDEEGGGIIARKQDITSLYGLDDNSFDFVILNNVLYAVHDADACLKEAYRVLKPGGELRLSGPRKDTKLSVLFSRILEELKESDNFQELEPDYRRVWQINELKLGPMLYRWSTQEVEEMLLGPEIGFSKILHSSDDIYAGQSMLVCAVK
jgi:ubiquinone/menaquinone biosynthesis C-methylase UbiE